MQSGPERGAAAGAARPRMIAVLLASIAGFGITLFVFYPGVMTLDARYVYSDIAKNYLGDWQSPVMTVLWAAIDPIAPGSASMFLLIVTLYWLAFALIGAKIARHSWLGLALPIFALTPPAFVLVGIIWRDVLFAALWLLAAALVFDVDRRKFMARQAQVLALLLVALGVLLRPNAIPAAPLLAVYILWPERWSLKRAALFYVPAFIGFVSLVPAVYYGLLGATRQYPLHALLVFDLGGITYFSKENQFPVSWTPNEARLLTERCYQPDKWDGYWYLEPCKFVMGRLEGETKIFGTPALADSWRRAVMQHPIAYLQHRAAFMKKFLGGTNLVMWTHDIENPTRIVFADRPAFMWLLEMQEMLQPTLLFKQATWLVLCVAIAGIGWRKRDRPEGAFFLGVCGSGAIYVVSYFFVGVASDFRYSYWAVLAALTGVAVLLAGYMHARRATSDSGAIVTPPQPS